ncbi:MAG: PucR family transcriptional regulator [Moorellales bacterium]
MPEAGWDRIRDTVCLFTDTLDRAKLAAQLLECVCFLAGAAQGVLAVRDGGGRGYRVYHHPAQGNGGNLVLSLTEVVGPQPPGSGNEEAGLALLEETLLLEEGPRWVDSSLLVPLRAAGSLVGVIVLPAPAAANWQPDRQCLLSMVCCCGALALEVASVAERTEQRLQEKLAEIHIANLMLREQHRVWKSYLDTYRRLNQMVLENQGIGAIGQALYDMLKRPLWVEGELGQEIILVGWPTDRPLFRAGDPAQQGTAGSSDGCREFVAPLVAGQELLGHLHVLLEGRLLGAFEQMVLESAATVLGLELAKQRIARETELRLRADFLKRLLNGVELPVHYVEAEARRLGLRLDPGYRVLLLKPIGGETDRAEEACAALMRALKERRNRLNEWEYEGFVVERSGETLLIVLGPEEEERSGRERMRTVAEELMASVKTRGLTVRGGVSSPGRKASELPRLLKEAVKALDMAIAGMGPPVAWYQDLGVFAWVELDPQGLRDATYRLLGPVLEYEKTHNLNLLETLSLYYRHNCNLRKTAAAGFLSLSTVRYRLQRIRQLCGLDLEDPETRLQVQLALRFLRQYG